MHGAVALHICVGIARCVCGAACLLDAVHVSMVLFVLGRNSLIVKDTSSYCWCFCALKQPDSEGQLHVGGVCAVMTA